MKIENVLFVKEGTNLEEFGFIKGYDSSRVIRVHIDRRNEDKRYDNSLWTDGWIAHDCYYGDLKAFYKLVKAGLVEMKDVEEET